MIALRGLAGFAGAHAAAAEAPACELCGSTLAERHQHVVEIGKRGVQCACRPCALLFDKSTNAGSRFRTVPDRVIRGELALGANAWAQLGVPVGLVFFVRDGAKDAIVASYPGPAGIIDGELPPATWQAVAAATPLAGELAPDVEALLVHGERGATRMVCYLVPITAAFELAGRLRANWHGFSGGDEARRELATFFAALDRKGARR